MALSVGSLGGLTTTSYMSVQPQSYALHNQSSVSTAYEESMQQGMIHSTHPVQYSSAQLTENHIAQLQASQKLEQAFQSVAAGLDGYTVPGAVIDTFA